MRKIILLSTLFIAGFNGWSQLRFEKLVINSNEQFVIDGQSDIIVADTLIMMDGSSIILNSLKPENYLRTNVAVIGQNCSIIGAGQQGKPGKCGKSGSSQPGPCRDGLPAENGSNGLAGGHGVNLFFYVSQLRIDGNLTIDLRGGTGGDGGMGGKGGDGNPGTLHCNGGNGATGGTGGRGGRGGNGGNLAISAPNPGQLTDWIGSLIVCQTNGGDGGRGGKGGYPGAKGLGPSNKYGKDGATGTFGEPGDRGKDGTLTFEINR